MRKYGTILIAIIFGTAAVAEIIASDEAGRKYALHEDGTWAEIAVEDVGQTEIAEKAAKIFIDYQAMYEKTVPDDVTSCLKNTISENADSNFEKITFPLSQNWEVYQQWVRSVSIVNGKTTTADLASGMMFVAATHQIALGCGFKDQ